MSGDDALYRRYLSGDNAAYDKLMIRYGDSLTFFLYGYLHNWQDAEDPMIEAFARIMVKKPKIGEGAFKAYLYRTARNLASRFHANKYRRQEFSLEDLEGEIPDRLLTEEQVQKQEKKEILHLCLKRIDPQFREALWLVYFEDMNYEQAADVMNVNKKKIDNLLMRGKKHLKEELGKEGITHAYE